MISGILSNSGYMLWYMGIEWNFYIAEGKFISWKEGLVNERKIWSMKRRYCLRKEEFVYELSNSGYILWYMGIEWNFYFAEEKFISWKEGLAYFRI